MRWVHPTRTCRTSQLAAITHRRRPPTPAATTTNRQEDAEVAAATTAITAATHAIADETARKNGREAAGASITMTMS